MTASALITRGQTEEQVMFNQDNKKIGENKTKLCWNFRRQIKRIVHVMTWTWLRRGNVKREMELLS